MGASYQATSVTLPFSDARDPLANYIADQVTDEVKPDWDLSGAVQDVQLLLEVGSQVANGAKFPEWKPGVEFKPKRDAMMKK